MKHQRGASEGLWSGAGGGQMQRVLLEDASLLRLSFVTFGVGLSARPPRRRPRRTPGNVCVPLPYLPPPSDRRPGFYFKCIPLPVSGFKGPISPPIIPQASPPAHVSMRRSALRLTDGRRRLCLFASKSGCIFWVGG